MEYRTPSHRVTRLGIVALAATALTVGGTAAFAGSDSAPRSVTRAAAVDSPADRESRNERIAVAFMELAINQQQPQEAADRYMGDTFIQHNPQNPDGSEAFVSWANGLIAVAPDVNVDIKRTLGDGNLVMVHSHFTTSADDRGFAVADLFRLKNGRIVEHWDVLQPVPATSANDNTMF